LPRLTTSALNPVATAPALRGGALEGWDALRGLLAERARRLQPPSGRRGRGLRIALDGYTGTDWDRVRGEIAALGEALGGKIHFVDIGRCLYARRELEARAGSCLPPQEPIFGRVCREPLSSFFDPEKLREAARKIGSSRRSPLICYGSGAALPSLRKHFDFILYFDLTREQVLKRNRSWAARKSKTQSISPRRTYYVDYPVHDAHRKRTLPHADYYVDANDPGSPKLLGRAELYELIGELVHMPFRVKPLYEPGVWGGQWLKRRRNLPRDLVNCAYGFEIIAPEQSVRVAAGPVVLELPFNLLMERAATELMGEQACRRFHNEFPIRFAYDDTWEGGDLSVQVHPGAGYARSRFGERLPQAEMYYIFDTKPGSRVQLGLRNGAKRSSFYRLAREAERRRRPFDHRTMVNAVPARKGEILLIPPGTVHGAGADELVLEISSTPYRYTFKIYDYCRPDLDGGYRPISIEHAFAVLKFNRTEGWVRRHLQPAPRLLRSGRGWRELVLADSKAFGHVVHRVEFSRSYTDDTGEAFHILNLVEGEKVTVQRRNGKQQPRELALSETVLIPKATGPYRVVNAGDGPCKIVKAFPRLSR
jgi:mannose-6-phosphate isomerase class I